MNTAPCAPCGAWRLLRRIRITHTMRRLLIVIALLAAGCSRVPLLPGMTPHRIDIQQGNYITQDMVAKLKPGMTRSQVRYLLGTPLVADPFHAERWDYVYHMQKKGGTTEYRRIVLLFDQDRLSRIEGDVVPAPAGGAAAAAPQPAAGTKNEPAGSAQDAARPKQ